MGITELLVMFSIHPLTAINKR